MVKEIIQIDGIKIPEYTVNTAVVGSGAAGLNAADWLFDLGVKDTLIITEGLYMGTSRNTGSDKQTYYKVSTSALAEDSAYKTAKTLFDGGSMHGDIAMCEAACSLKCFYKLAVNGVPFPFDEFGSHIGYKTDHDPLSRASSAGPLTSKIMTDALTRRIIEQGIDILDGHLVINVLTDGEKVLGLLTFNRAEAMRESRGLSLVRCANVIYATGGPAGIYLDSVYPESQHGMSGAPLLTGIRAVNLTESQYGLASVKFRWNVSGTYQQVLPKYISADKNGENPREFLSDYFDNPSKALDMVFLKGYQWPFDARKVQGSSIIDLIVDNETHKKGRRVFMDFRENPAGLENGFDALSHEAYEYLKSSGALFGTPYERLLKMNPKAIKLYKDHGIDLEKEPLEVRVCAQHSNGGLAVDKWWRTNIEGFFAVGECAGTHGVYRPGGSALNSGQVGSMRAAQYIANNSGEVPDEIEFARAAKDALKTAISITKASLDKKGRPVDVCVEKARAYMSKCGAHIREYEDVKTALSEVGSLYEDFFKNCAAASALEMDKVFRARDMLITQYAFLRSILDYIKAGGASRGSYLICGENGNIPHEKLPGGLKFTPYSNEFDDRVLEIEIKEENEKLTAHTLFSEVRPLPKPETWFETVWADFDSGKIYRK